jgi:hypothetical protein
MERVEPREAAKISFIRRDDGNPAPGRAHGEQGIVGLMYINGRFMNMVWT